MVYVGAEPDVAISSHVASRTSSIPPTRLPIEARPFDVPNQSILDGRNTWPAGEFKK
jgi:hypothetical protein